MLVSILCSGEKLKRCVEGCGSKMSVAFEGVKAIKGRIGNVACVSGGPGLLRISSDDCWNLLQDCLADGEGDVGWDGGVRNTGGPSSLSTSKEEKAVGSRAEGGYGYGEGVGAGA